MPYAAEIRTVIDRFHDVHHAFPNALGTLSQRGRFHGWKKVHDASVCCLPVGSLQVSVFVGCLFGDHCILSLLERLNSKTKINDQCLETKHFQPMIFTLTSRWDWIHDWSKHGEIMTEMASQERKTRENFIDISAPSFVKVEVLYRGLWKPNGDEETEMQKQQKKRSLLMRQGQWRPQCQFPTWVQWKNKNSREDKAQEEEWIEWELEADGRSIRKILVAFGLQLDSISSLIFGLGNHSCQGACSVPDRYTGTEQLSGSQLV